MPRGLGRQAGEGQGRTGKTGGDLGEAGEPISGLPSGCLPGAFQVPSGNFFLLRGRGPISERSAYSIQLLLLLLMAYSHCSNPKGTPAHSACPSTLLHAYINRKALTEKHITFGSASCNSGPPLWPPMNASHHLPDLNLPFLRTPDMPIPANPAWLAWLKTATEQILFQLDMKTPQNRLFLRCCLVRGCR